MAIAVNMTDRQAKQFLAELQRLPLKRQKILVRRIAEHGKKVAQQKVRAGGGVAPSKWVQARKGVNKALVGVDRKIEVFMTGDAKAIVDVLDPRYSLGQHARGYTKPAGAGGVEDRVFGDWVIIPLANPGALSPPVSNPFMYNWRKNRTPSVVPARDVLPSDADMGTQGNIIAQKWAQEIVSMALAKVGL